MDDQNRASVDALRLRWLVKDEPVKATIHVLDDALDPKSAQQPYQNDSGELHPISKASISTKPLKELDVTLPDLENVNTYNECPEDDPDYVDGEGLPYDEPTCSVTASNGEFITIADYINAVNPWLLSLRDRYFEDAPIPGEEFDPDTQLWVKPWSLIGGIELHHDGTHTEASRNELVWSSAAKMAGNLQTSPEEEPPRRFLTDEEKMEIVRQYQKETGMDKVLWSGRQY